MKCSKCGFEMQEISAFCPNCGNQTVADEPAQPISQHDFIINPIGQRVLDVFKDPMFMVISILVSVGALLQMFSGAIPVISVLLTIFLWIIFASARKEKADYGMMRCVSGTLFAEKICIIVVGALLLLLGLITVVLIGAVNSSLDFGSIIYEIFEEADINIDSSAWYILSQAGVGLITAVFGVLVAAVVAVLIVVYIATDKLHKFAKSLYMSVQSGTMMIQKKNAAKNWMLTMAIFSGLGTLGGVSEISTFAVNVVNCAVYILAYLLVKKHFSDIEA